MHFVYILILSRIYSTHSYEKNEGILLNGDPVILCECTLLIILRPYSGPKNFFEGA